MALFSTLILQQCFGSLHDTLVQLHRSLYPGHFKCWFWFWLYPRGHAVGTVWGWCGHSVEPHLGVHNHHTKTMRQYQRHPVHMLWKLSQKETFWWIQMYVSLWGDNSMMYPYIPHCASGWLWWVQKLSWNIKTHPTIQLSATHIIGCWEGMQWEREMNLSW